MRAASSPSAWQACVFSGLQEIEWITTAGSRMSIDSSAFPFWCSTLAPWADVPCSEAKAAAVGLSGPGPSSSQPTRSPVDFCALNAHDERGSHRSGALTPACVRRAFGGAALLHAVCQNRCVESDDVDRPRQVETGTIPGGQFPGDEWRRVMRLWLVVRGSRGDLEGRTIRLEEGQHAVEPTNHAESAFVNGAVMASAKEHEVVEARGAAIRPVFHVMGVAPTRRAAGKATSSVAGSQGAADRWRNRARLAAHVDHGTVGVVAHVHQRGVARQSLRRFRGGNNILDGGTSCDYTPYSWVCRRR